MENENKIEKNSEEKNQEEIEGEENLNEEMYNENDNDNDNLNINNDDEEEEEQGADEIISPSNELNNEIVEQHEKNQNLEEEEEVEEEKQQQEAKELQEKIENLTDSDIDDPKYKPYYDNNKHLSTDIINLNQKINFLEKNNNFLNKSLKE